jgi:hypothetical protein
MLRRSLVSIGRFSFGGLALAALLSGSACGGTKASSATLSADAAPPCDPGTRACICTSDGTCDDDLICITGRCFDTEGTPQPNDRGAPTGHAPPPTIYVIDAGSTTTTPDAAAPTLPDASPSIPVPDASAP